MLRRLLIFTLAVFALAAGAVYWFFSGDGVRRALERQATAWLGQPVRIANASAQIFPRIAVQLRDVRIGNPARVSLADVEVSTGLRALFGRRVEDAEIILSDSRLDLPLPFSLPTTTSATASSTSSAAFTVASIRAITLEDIRVASRGREILVSAESSLSGNRLELTRFFARSGETAVEASGTVELAPAIHAKLRASANRLDFDDLLALVDAFTPPQPTRRGGTLLPGRLDAQLRAARGTAAGVQLGNLAATLTARGNRVTLSPASFELFGGRYEGTLDADLGDRLTVALISRMTGLDVAELAAFGGVAGTITGRLSGDGRFTGRGRDFAAVLAAASGSGRATITDGTMRRLELVRTVVLFFGRPATDAPASAGERFSRMAATFQLARQVLTSDSLTMESPDVNLAGSGTLTIPTKALDGRANLLLSEELTAQAGTDLVRFTREGNRVVLPAIVGGTLDRPRVTIDAVAAARRGIRNEVERRLKGLFDRLKPPPP